MNPNIRGQTGGVILLGTVRLIDCDSFQITANGRLLLCDVGVPEYTPPELQGVPFRSVSRTENHDRFGLAVLIFHLLFMGRHPFFGRFVGVGEMPLERAIREFRFAFGAASSLKQMAPPPHSLPFATFPSELTGLFERAFHDQSAAAITRPTARQWYQTLSSLLKQTVSCQNDVSHKYPSSLSACPWCAIVAAGGPAFFIAFQAGVVEFICAPTDLDGLVAELQRLSIPSPPPSVLTALTSSPAPLPSTAAVAHRHISRAKLLIGAGAGLLALGFIVAVAVSAITAGSILALLGILSLVWGSVWSWWLANRSEYGRERHRRAQAFDHARLVADQAEAALFGLTGGFQEALQQIKSRGEALRRHYTGLRPAYDSEVRLQAQDKEAAQRRGYLQSRLIADDKIKGIGNGRKAQLVAYGIETAYDVLHGDLNIPRFGPASQQALQAWAHTIDAAFHFDPSKNVPEAERRMLVMKFRQQPHVRHLRPAARYASFNEEREFRLPSPSP